MFGGPRKYPSKPGRASFIEVVTDATCAWWFDNADITRELLKPVMPPGVITYNLKEDADGSLYDEEKNMRWYTVLLGHGLEVNYVCSVKGGIPVGLPLGSIFISKKHVDSINESILNIPRAILAEWGIRFIYNYSYSSSCFY